MPILCHVMLCFLRVQRWRGCVLAPWVFTIWWWNQTHTWTDTGVNGVVSTRDGDQALPRIFRKVFTEKGTLTWQWRSDWWEPDKQVEKEKNLFLNAQTSKRERCVCLFILPFRKSLLSTFINTQMNKAVSFCSSLVSTWLAQCLPHGRCSVIHIAQKTK